MKEVDILLATYNGSKYIKQQMLSICAQTFEHWNLLIHDDGSLDNTLDIVRNLALYDSRISIIEDGTFYGNAAENFLHLLKYSTAPYIMFCDQDDIWFDNKVEVMLKIMKEKGQEKPQVLYSNSYVWQSNGGILSLGTVTFPKKMSNFLFLNNGTQGCVSMFNQKMKNLLMMWQGKCAMHDHLLHLMALSFGEVTYKNMPLMLYRQHESSVTFVTENRIWGKVKNFFNRNKYVLEKQHYKTVQKFYEDFADEIPLKDKKIFKSYLKFPEVNLAKRLWLILKYRFTLYNLVSILLLKTIIRRPMN